jgi:hypothetical protein
MQLSIVERPAQHRWSTAPGHRFCHARISVSICDQAGRFFCSHLKTAGKCGDFFGFALAHSFFSP